MEDTKAFVRAELTDQESMGVIQALASLESLMGTLFRRRCMTISEYSNLIKLIYGFSAEFDALHSEKETT